MQLLKLLNMIFMCCLRNRMNFYYSQRQIINEKKCLGVKPDTVYYTVCPLEKNAQVTPVRVFNSGFASAR